MSEFAKVIRSADMNDYLKKKILDAIGEMKFGLEQLERDVDAIRMPNSFFDPSEPRLIGHFVALALISQERVRLSAIEPTYGSGVYAIYYTGNEEIYASISATETPIYVGKADPPVGAKSIVEQETRLYRRLNEHRKSIDKVSGIDVADFECRALAVQSGYQTAAESYLIDLFRPIWNNETRILFGLGKHGDAATTRANNKSPWDTIHPGRTWAMGNREARGTEDILLEVARHFRLTKVFQSSEDVFSAFAEGIRMADRLK
ncbi:Eco29kI family restriction endonuclease [Loktanella sp. M215]|uniref:Eco29kI family restriction endonuclease n=1 Tax=Loktanella sp. M215 TaxID=2675431 RepID=UPI001F2FA88B|nr:Eco29kI family restriction endonuclease [Loktanella sp. M215]